MTLNKIETLVVLPNQTPSQLESFNKKEALERLDASNWTWAHWRAILVAGY